MKSSKVHFTLYVGKEEFEKIKERAKSTGMSKAQVIRLILRKELLNEKQ